MIYNWKDIQQNYLKQLKILPIAAIRYKSCNYRLILDLSFSIKMSRKLTKLVNETLLETAPRKVLSYIGTTLSWIIHNIATALASADCLLTKVDIKDGF